MSFYRHFNFSIYFLFNKGNDKSSAKDSWKGKSKAERAAADENYNQYADHSYWYDKQGQP